MVAPAFEYVAAGSYDEAVRLLAESAASGEEAKILAGGQSLMPMLNLRLAHPDLLIDINPADQRAPSQTDGLLRLPALTRHRVLLEHEMVRQHCPLLAEAIRHVGNVRVRNRGTIGGSLAHADPTSEIGCCALATGARVVARGPRRRTHRSGQRPVRRLLVHHPGYRGDHHRRPGPGRPAAPGLVFSRDGPPDLRLRGRGRRRHC